MTRLVFAIVVIGFGSVAAGAGPYAGIRALVGQEGRVSLWREKDKIGNFGAGLFNQHWVSADATADAGKPNAAEKRHLQIAVPGGGEVTGWAVITGDQGGLQAQYVFTPEQDLALNSLHVSVEFSIPTLASGRWTADQRSGTFPADFGDIQIFQGPIRKLAIELPAGGNLRWSFSEPTSVLIQDNRQWGPSFSVRIFRSAMAQQPFLKGFPVTIDFSLAAAGGVSVEYDTPVTIVADKDWIPLPLELEILPGSALDFSTLGLQDAPAGKHGWLKAAENGSFFFERQPDQPVRFYGVNICFSAHYISHEQSDRLADRLVRLGYNAVRLHHYESELTERHRERTRLNPQKLDQLDYLVAALIRRGIYVTTDLYVSRPVEVAQFLPDSDSGRGDAMNRFKVLAALNPGAYENWKAFARLPWSGRHPDRFAGRYSRLGRYLAVRVQSQSRQSVPARLAQLLRPGHGSSGSSG